MIYLNGCRRGGESLNEIRRYDHENILELVSLLENKVSTAACCMLNFSINCE